MKHYGGSSFRSIVEMFRLAKEMFRSFLRRFGNRREELGQLAFAVLVMFIFMRANRWPRWVRDKLGLT